MEGELGADDCYNSAPAENHLFHKAQSITDGDGGSEEGGREGVEQLLSARKWKFLKLHLFLLVYNSLTTLEGFSLEVSRL